MTHEHEQDPYPVGSVGQITDGPFRGFRAIVAAPTSAETLPPQHLWVSVEIFGRTAIITIHEQSFTGDTDTPAMREKLCESWWQEILDDIRKWHYQQEMQYWKDCCKQPLPAKENEIAHYLHQEWKTFLRRQKEWQVFCRKREQEYRTQYDEKIRNIIHDKNMLSTIEECRQRWREINADFLPMRQKYEDDKQKWRNDPDVFAQFSIENDAARARLKQAEQYKSKKKLVTPASSSENKK